jgi:hypothetical protein
MAEEGGLSSSSSSCRLNNYTAINGVDKRSNESNIIFIRNLIVKRDREIADLEAMREDGNLTKDELDKLSAFSRDEFQDAKRQCINEGTVEKESMSAVAIAVTPPLYDGKGKQDRLIKEETKVVATLRSSAAAVLNENLADTPSIDTLNVSVKLPNIESLKLKIRQNTRMRIIFSAVSRQIGVANDILKFVFNGNKVEPKDTASMLDINDGDQLDCLITSNDVIKTGIVNLTVKNDTLMSKVFKAVASQQGIEEGDLRF